MKHTNKQTDKLRSRSEFGIKDEQFLQGEFETPSRHGAKLSSMELDKSLRLQKCLYKVNLSRTSKSSFFNMTQCSRTISSTVWGLISPLSWLVSDYQFLTENLEGKCALFWDNVIWMASSHSFPFMFSSCTTSKV